MKAILGFCSQKFCSRYSEFSKMFALNFILNASNLRLQEQ